VTPEHWRQVEDVFHAARERPAGERARFLEQAAIGDEVRRDVRHLLDQPEDSLLPGGLSGALAALAAPVGRTGTRLGPYELVSLLGAGTMGDVYRARDTRLGREVAVKILPEALGQDPDRVARFEREARVLATLNHPNIATLYGIAEDGGLRGLVLELVEGSTLAALFAARRTEAENAAAGGLPLTDAMSIAQQLARGLEAAHAQGIVHRDLKPANIAITPAGVVKVLDFGLAKIALGAAASPGLSPALETRDGIVLGTVAYMSPEQARGFQVDKRTDIWAFGCVLYEMLCGARPFQGATSADVLAAIVGAEPDWRRLPADTPVQVRAVLRRCLMKDPERRIHDIADARIDLEEPREPESALAAPATPGSGAARRLATRGIAAAAAVLALGAAYVGWPPASPPRPALRASVNVDESIVVGEGSIVLSPDGRSMVYQARGADNVQRLYRRELDGSSSVPIAGTDNGHMPFFSPDGQWVGFAVERELKKVPIGGGPPATICPIQSHFGASWGDDGFIVLSLAPETALHRCPASGGAAEPYLTRVPQDVGNDHRYPSTLPDGRGVIYAVATGPARDARIVVFDARAGTRRDLLHGAASARLVGRDRLAYAIDGDLFVVGFDLDRLELVGDPVRLVSGVAEETDGAPEYSFSSSGDLVYVAGRAGGPRNRMMLVDMSGRATPLNIPPSPLGFPRVSPDGRTVAYLVAGAKTNVWTFDLERGVASRETFGRFHYPVWTPAGQLTMAEGGLGAQRLVLRASSDGRLDMLNGPAREQAPEDWTPDGRTLVFRFRDAKWQLWSYSRDDRTVRLLLDAGTSTHTARIAPNGRWLLYNAREDGPQQIYVRSMVSGSARQQVSRDPATQGAWAPDGRTIYYRGLEGSEGDGLWAVEVTESAAQLRIGAPRRLFATAGFAEEFDVTRDGRNFVMVQQDREMPAPRQLQLALNSLGRAGTP
jgi:serine/threonine-protein kinase